MVELIAHRGASHAAPENTRAAIRLAWAEGADAAEIDVCLARDAAIVAIHDDTTLRTAGRDQRVAEQTLAELKALDAGGWKSPRWAGERIPTLAEIIAELPPDKKLYVEIKCGPEIIAPLVELFAAARLRQGVVFIGFSREILRELKQRLPGMPALWIQELQFDKDTRVWNPAAADCARLAIEAGLDGLDLSACAGLDDEFVKLVHAAGLSLAVWTVDSAADASRLAAAGVDAITTNRPGPLRLELGALSAPPPRSPTS